MIPFEKYLQFRPNNSQVLLESVNAVPSKFLQFVENQGILVNVNSKNHIEIWDIEKNLLADVHAFEEDITSFTVMQHSLYMYVGDSAGNVRVLKLEQEHIVQMKYTVPYSPSHGNPTEETGDTSVIHVLPQPAVESKRVLIIFRDGIISLWDIRESKTVSTAGGNALQSLHHEGKKVTSACWACPFGSKVAVG
ncbi:Transducin/WD40 repeat-like superfamily protein [Prunus dulcis]|uniref:Transducin/WD40 repeat-like superfamily protein n=1 Tax=Prunus dulcis TaxID=3755 RepID=A0A4Y1RWI4_PRUDU|nr:Transducin/WD40 repeat-like superfamily protein [Prunus dulcis]